MATGYSNQLTRQIGEHFVAAQLGRMGFIATPFAGNVPLFDLLAANELGFTIPIQVKTINGGDWQYSAGAFLEIEIIDGVQRILGKKTLPSPNLVCVYILLGSDEAGDEVYVFTLQDLQEHTFQVYKSRKRPNRTESLHCTVNRRHLQQFRDNWELIRKSFDE